MSTRLLIFGGNELILRCAESCYFHCGQEEGTYTSNLHNKRLNHSDWYQIAEAYSARHRGFSHATDTLPALSGTAAFFSRRLGNLREDEYVAGLWKDSLFYGLAWRIPEDREHLPRGLVELLASFSSSTTSCVSPSWAWPGKGAIIFPEVPERVAAERLLGVTPKSEVQHAWTVLKGQNPFGEVDAGGLKITGKIAELTASDQLEHHWWPPNLRVKEPWGFSLNVESVPVWLFYLDWETEEEALTGEGLKMIVTGSGRNFLDEEEYFGILLHESDTLPGKYHRVGAFNSAGVWENLATRFFEGCETETVDVI